MKSLCLDRLPAGCTVPLERCRMSVHTVGRCFTDCRHLCSPSQNLHTRGGEGEGKRERERLSEGKPRRLIYDYELRLFMQMSDCPKEGKGSGPKKQASFFSNTVHEKALYYGGYLYIKTKNMDLLKLLKPGDNTLHIIIDGLLNVIQHGLIWRERAQ